MLLTTASGSSALLAASMVGASPTRATIVGTAARIELASPFYASTGLVVTWQAGAVEDSLSWQGEPLDDVYDALAYEATALATYVGEGRTESPLHTLTETLSILGTLDTVRAQIS